MTPRGVRLPDGRVWLRVADPAWRDPFDSGFSREHGGRWNPPGSHATLYLNGDIATCRKQIERMLTGFPVHIDDLDDHAFMLAAATLPRAQTCADAVTHEGIRALGLPESYPAYPGGRRVPHDMCTAIGVRVRLGRPGT